jgi:hypothetical protein
MSSGPASQDAHHSTHVGAGLVGLALGALGIVYGDIGTSPLYAFRETFEGHDLEVTRDGVYGACSVTFWALVIIITIKYLLIVMRADNRGEGGILALSALLPRATGARVGALLLSLGIFGTALLYGDGMITPAISVLSAVEGVDVATSALEQWIIPIACAILAGLFLVQKRGTAGVGKIFGPVMFVWFLVIGGLGLIHIVDQPAILKALNPVYAVTFFDEYRLNGFWALGSIFLVVTGGEALYVDMGHFGRRPIRLAWFAIVLPCLVLNYFGQAALLLRQPEASTNPFFTLVPEWGLYPMVAIATSAAIVASQALISGAFSLTRQAVQMDYLPALAVDHVVQPDRPGLRPDRQLDPDVLVHRARDRVRLLEQPRGRLRHRRHDDDGDHHLAADGGGTQPLGVVAVPYLPRGHTAAAHRPVVHRRAADQDPPRRLVRPRGGRGAVHAHDDVAQGPPGRGRRDPAGRDADERVRRAPAHPRAPTGAGHGGVPLQGRGRHACGAPRQPPPQQGPAREVLLVSIHHRLSSVPREPGVGHQGRPGHLAGGLDVRLLATSPTSPRPWPACAASSRSISTTSATSSVARPSCPRPRRRTWPRAPVRPAAVRPRVRPGSSTSRRAVFEVGTTIEI